MFYRKILLKNRKYVLNNYEDNSIKFNCTHWYNADTQNSLFRRRHSGAILRHFYSLLLTELR